MKKTLSLVVMGVMLILTLGLVAAVDIKTTTSTCEDIVNENHYVEGENVYVHVIGFENNTKYPWDITGQGGSENSEASCDPNTIIASGNQTTDIDGNLCFAAYTIKNDDCGEYKVTFGAKSPDKKTDNYRVGEDITVPEFGTTIGIATALGALGVFFLVRRK